MLAALQQRIARLVSGPPQRPSRASSTASARTGSAPVQVRKSVPPSPHSRPNASASVQPQQPQGTGTTIAQAQRNRVLLDRVDETRDLAGQAVGMLADLTAPKDAQEPSQIQEILAALTAIAESQARLEAQQERILRMLQPRTA